MKISLLIGAAAAIVLAYFAASAIYEHNQNEAACIAVYNRAVLQGRPAAQAEADCQKALR